MICIRISVNDEIKAIEFWVGNNENIDRRYINEIASQINNKYKKIMFRSGAGDLTKLTYDLFKLNP